MSATLEVINITHTLEVTIDDTVHSLTVEQPASVAILEVNTAPSADGGNADTLQNQSGAYYLSRSNHTGTQAMATITGLVAALAAKAAPADIANAIAALVDSSPAALDTLNELAQALGDDPNFATTVLNAIAAVNTALASKVDGTAGVKIYRPLVFQTETDAPYAIELENSLGGAVVWSRSSAGFYSGTLIGAFPPGKTHITAAPNSAVTGITAFGDSLVINTTGDDVMFGYSIQVLVYP
jgi:hypothetical protein